MITEQLLFQIEEELMMNRKILAVKNDELNKINDAHIKVTEALTHLNRRIDLLEQVKREYKPKVN